MKNTQNKTLVNQDVKCPNHLFRGGTGTGKTHLLQEHYRLLLKDDNFNGNKILVFVPNRSQVASWIEQLRGTNICRAWITTFEQFVQEEVKLYYPIILKNCDKIKSTSLSPIFLPYEVSVYLISKVIENRRDKKGSFSEVVARSEYIARDLISKRTNNILKNNLNTGDFFEELDEKSIKLNTDSFEIMDSYLNKCYSLAIFDVSMSYELYFKYLFKDSVYRDLLSEKVDKIIVDNLEEVPFSFLEVINFLREGANLTLASINHEKYNMYGNMAQEAELIKNFKIFDIGNTYTCDEKMNKLSEHISNNIRENISEKIKNKYIQKLEVTELRSEMLTAIGEKLISLTQNEGINPNDIAVISTYADSTSLFEINQLVEMKGLKLTNIKMLNRILDEDICLAIITFYNFCVKPDYENTDINLLNIMFQRMLDIDNITSGLICCEVLEHKILMPLQTLMLSKNWKRIEKKVDLDRYNKVYNFYTKIIEAENTLNLQEFIQSVFYKIILNDDSNMDEIKQISKLIKLTERYYKVFEVFKLKNINNDIVELLKSGVKYYKKEAEIIEDKIRENILFLTPTDYLSCAFNKKVIVLMGISSKNWVPPKKDRIKNVNVNEFNEDSNDRIYLSELIKGIMKRCNGKIITSESLLSVSGEENTGILSLYI